MREVKKSFYNVSSPSPFGDIKKMPVPIATDIDTLTITKQDDKWEQLERTDEQLAPHFMQYLSQHHPNFNTQLEEMGNKNELSLPNMVALVGEEIANKWLHTGTYSKEVRQTKEASPEQLGLDPNDPKAQKWYS